MASVLVVTLGLSSASHVVVVHQQGRLVIAKTLVHAADVSYIAKPWAVASVWAERAVQEFFAQVCVSVCVVLWTHTTPRSHRCCSC